MNDDSNESTDVAATMPERSAELLAEAVDILVQAVVNWDSDPSNIAIDIEQIRDYLNDNFHEELNDATEEANSSGSLED